MEKTVFAGLDEAGRGAVIGPLVIAGVSVSKKNEKRLKSLKLKDSKEHTPKQRELLAKEIDKIADDIVIVKLSACRIDNMRKNGTNLNSIETEKFADILSLLNSGTAYIDSHDVKPDRLKKTLNAMTNNISNLVVEHKADVRYPVVSAASIVAKVERDKEVKKLQKEFGDFGPGYSSNEKTIGWMENWLENNKDWPDIVRRSWVTAKEIKKKKSQKSVLGFFGKLAGKKEGC